MELSTRQKQTIVFGAIIVICVILAVVAGLVTRARNVDIRLISDVSRVRSTLELAHTAHSQYPDISTALMLGSEYDQTEILCTNGFVGSQGICEKMVLEDVPTSGIFYGSTENGEGYFLEFSSKFRYTNLGIAKGNNCATEQGIFSGQCAFRARGK